MHDSLPAARSLNDTKKIENETYMRINYYLFNTQTG